MTLVQVVIDQCEQLEALASGIFGGGNGALYAYANHMLEVAKALRAAAKDGQPCV